MGVFLNKDMDSLVADKGWFFFVLVDEFLPAHVQDLGVLFFPRFHAPMEVLAHRHQLQFHVNLAQ